MTRRAFHLVGTTHFDPVWLWTWDEALASIRGTFRAALDRMEEEPRFIYCFSCPPVFEWVRQTDPALFDEIRVRVREGRWHLVEGWWLEADCNAAGGESYCRQGLLGQRWLSAAFGRRSRTCFTIDSFGHSAQLPQILARSGMSFLVIGRPTPEELALPGPLFRWEGPDGSSVLAYRLGTDGTRQFSPTIDADLRAASASLERLGHDLMVVYGVTNHGGAPTRDAIRQIGALAGDASVAFDVRHSTPEQYFERQAGLPCPVVHGELQVKAFGVFSNLTEVKASNRACERALLDAEAASLIAAWTLGRRYPRDTLTSAWKDALFNQFHDILGGACVRPSYEHVRALHGRALAAASEAMHTALQAVTSRVDTTGNGLPLVMWNLNPFETDEPVEAEMQWAWEREWYRGPLSVVDETGAAVPCQVIRELSVLPGFRSRIVFRPRLPSLGYRCMRVLQRPPAPDPGAQPVRARDGLLENGLMRVEIDPATGGISSVIDIRRGRQVLRDAARAYVRKDSGDTWAFDVPGYGPEIGVFRQESSRLTEEGPVRAGIRTVSRFGDSVVEREYLLHAGMAAIDCRFRVSWRERHAVLKLGFDTLLPTPRLVSSVPYGSVDRPPDGREMPCREWLQASGEGIGIAFLGDSVFAYDMAGPRLSLTLLRSPIYGHLAFKDPIDPDADWEFMEQGFREGKVRIVIGDGAWTGNAVPRMAATFTRAPVCITESVHPGTQPRARSFIGFESDSSMLTALKLAEEGNDVVLRVVEYGGTGGRARVTLPLLGRDVTVALRPHEIRSLRLVRRKRWSARDVNILEESKP